MKTIFHLICAVILFLLPVPAEAKKAVEFTLFQTTTAELASVTIKNSAGGVQLDKSGGANAPVVLVVAATVTPPSGNYYYNITSRSGLPTRFTVAAKDPSGVLEVQRWQPVAVRKDQTSFASIVLQGIDDSKELIFAGEQVFWAFIPVFENGATVEASMSGLFCSERSCTPFNAKSVQTLTLQEVKQLPAAINQPAFASLAAGEHQQSVSKLAPGSSAASQKRSGLEVVAGGQGLSAFLGQEEPAEDGAVKNATLPFSLEPNYYYSSLEVDDIWKAIGLGMLAGLVMNLMPCVLPVVSLKFSALLAVTTMTDKQEQARAFRNHCLLFAVGVMTWFLFLALMLGGAGWAWGELFQNPVALAVLGLVLFILGLSLFGVFSLPILDLKVSSNANPHWQAFASGLLATLLATPCSGPLLGGVLGWAILQPIPVLVCTVMSIGFGMTIPYYIMAMSPGLINLLPRPGAWTLRLEQLLGFFLMGSVIYLVLLLPKDWMAGYLIVLLAVAFSMWLWGQIGHLGASRLRRFIARSCAVFVIILAIFWARLTLQKDVLWEPFTLPNFTESLGQEPMLVEFTADWCPNCKVLEQTTLRQERMARLRDKYGLRLIKVDLTTFDEAGFALLNELGSTSLPLLAIFPQGADMAKKPMVLRDIVTPGQLKDALKDALPR